MGAQHSAEDGSVAYSAAESSTADISKRTQASGADSAEDASAQPTQPVNGVSSSNGGQREPAEPGSGADAGGAQPPDAHGGDNEGQQGDEQDDDEEEGCAFCKFMKGGGCKDEFVAWEKCVADSRESGDFVGHCADITEALQACMNRPDNKDYYQLFLDDQEDYVREQREIDETEAKTGADESDEDQVSQRHDDSSGHQEQSGKDETAPETTAAEPAAGQDV